MALVPRTADRQGRVPWGTIGLWTVSIPVLVYLLFPILVVIPISFSSAAYLAFPPPGLSLQWYAEYFSRSQWTSATLLSFEVGVMTALLAAVLGTLAAFGLVRGEFRGKQLIHTLVILPVVVPVTILAVAFYHLYARMHLVGTVAGLVLAHTVLALPFVVITVSATLKGFDRTVERAAQSLGAGPLLTFRKVTFPLIRPGIVSGALFAFITSFDEVVIAIFISGSSAITLPRQMWDGIRTEINPTIAAVSSLLIGMSLMILLFVVLLGRWTDRLRGGGRQAVSVEASTTGKGLPGEGGVGGGPESWSIP